MRDVGAPSLHQLSRVLRNPAGPGALFFGVALLGTILKPNQAFAMRFYWELGVGASWISRASTLLGNTGGLSPGPALALGLGVSTASDSRESSLQFAFQGRTVSGASSDQHFTLMTGYPILRLTTRRLSLEMGASPLVYSRVAAMNGVSNFSKVPGAIGFLGGLAYETILNPQASLLWTVGVQGFRSNEVLSPWPIAEAGVNLRIFIGGSENFSKSDRKSPFGDDYQGWRYPFGRGR